MQTRTLLSTVAIVCAASLLSACATLGKPKTKSNAAAASAQLKDNSGADRGKVDVFRDGNDLRLEVVARGFNAGTYGMHVHTVGKCDAPDFASAGPHWNPTGAQHGRDNPLGQHRGDLPNLVVEAGTIGRVTVMIPDGAMSGDGGLLDADGGSFIIHAQADDLRTDPTGNSGGRVVCGVFGPV
ncbi:MAG: superoxide dismutase family protein [Sphingopyxis sp.]|nr:superoxide dismutase family protein [Sphingopyxis sp.]